MISLSWRSSGTLTFSRKAVVEHPIPGQNLTLISIRSMPASGRFERALAGLCVERHARLGLIETWPTGQTRQ